MNTKMVKQCIASIVTGMALAAADGHAAERGFYVNFDAGANWVPDFEVSFDGGAETDVDLDTGFRGGVAFGYNLNRFFGLELESGFLYNEADGADAWLGQVPLIASVIFRHDNPSRFVPFVGAGAGGVAAIVSLEEGDADEDDSDIVFAWQFQGGMRYKISEHSSLGIAYKYLGTDSPEFSLGASDQDFDVIHNHSVVATFNLAF
jgi:opacity protein-like surface antigen